MLEIVWIILIGAGVGALAKLCLRLQRLIMGDYVTLRRSQHGAGAAGERSC